MKQDISQILKEALKLPPEARAAFAGTLLDSLEESLDRDADDAWEAGAALRLNGLDSLSYRPYIRDLKEGGY
jgi:hypothetical protein